MRPDREGFIYPVIDSLLCVGCGLCKKICPVLNRPERWLSGAEPDIYAAWNLDAEVRRTSTSGGIFSALADRVLEKGGFVAAARYSDSHMVEHTIIHSKEELALVRQSKYLQSTIGTIYSEVRKLLNGGSEVLFCGTPCQNAGLRSFLGKEYAKLYCCDFICRGVNSPKVFSKYLRSLETSNSSGVSQVWFKNKINGWNQFGTKVNFCNGETYFNDRYHDPFMVGYLQYNLYCRPSCYQCHFKGLQRFSDITLADFWGIGGKCQELDDNKGTSLVMIHTEKGNELFRSIRNRVFSQQRCVQDALDSAQCLMASIRPGGNRARFFREIDRYDFEYLMKKYACYTSREKLCIVLRKIYNALRLYVIKRNILKLLEKLNARRA